MVFPSIKHPTRSPWIAPLRTVLFVTVHSGMAMALKAYVAVIRLPSRTRPLEAPLEDDVGRTTLEDDGLMVDAGEDLDGVGRFGRADGIHDLRVTGAEVV